MFKDFKPILKKYCMKLYGDILFNYESSPLYLGLRKGLSKNSFCDRGSLVNHAG